MTEPASDLPKTDSEEAVVDPKTWKPGDVLRHRASGMTVRLHRRKDDGSGWWMTDGSGLVDWMAQRTSDWVHELERWESCS